MSYNKDLMKSYQGKPCICCDTDIGTVAHHVTSKGASGSDDPHNLMVLCHQTHRLIHDHGLVYVAIKNDNINSWLCDNGWEMCLVRNKWVHTHNNMFF